MALEPFFLEVVGCPDTKRPLRLADDNLNLAFKAGLQDVWRAHDGRCP